MGEGERKSWLLDERRIVLGHNDGTTFPAFGSPRKDAILWIECGRAFYRRLLKNESGF